MKVAKDLLHIFRVLVIDFKMFKQQDAESLGTFVILLAVQMPFFCHACTCRLGSSLHFRTPTKTKYMQGVGRQASCESSLLQTHRKHLNQWRHACPSSAFIHIPKAKGFSMEMARLLAAGISAPEGHSQRFAEP